MVKQPSIELWGVILQEPTTTISDIFLAGFCFYWFLKVKNRFPEDRAAKFQRRYYIFLALGTLAGGILGHGFNYRTLDGMKLPGWALSMVAVQWMAYSVLEDLRKYWTERTFTILVWTHTGVGLFMLLWFLWTWDFKIPQLHAGYGMLVVLGLGHLFLYLAEGQGRSLYFLLGLLPLVMMAVVFAQKWSLHIWFNENDISHVMMGLASYLFYIGWMYPQSEKATKRALLSVKA